MQNALLDWNDLQLVTSCLGVLLLRVGTIHRRCYYCNCGPVYTQILITLFENLRTNILGVI